MFRFLCVFVFFSGEDGVWAQDPSHGCQSVIISGPSGDMCSPMCSNQTTCRDVPIGDTATPERALRTDKCQVGVAISTTHYDNLSIDCENDKVSVRAGWIWILAIVAVLAMAALGRAIVARRVPTQREKALRNAARLQEAYSQSLDHVLGLAFFDDTLLS